MAEWLSGRAKIMCCIAFRICTGCLVPVQCKVVKRFCPFVCCLVVAEVFSGSDVIDVALDFMAADD